MRASVSAQNRLAGWWRNPQGGTLAVYQYRSESKSKGYPRESMDVKQYRPNGQSLGLHKVRVIDLQRVIECMNYAKVGDNPYAACPEAS